MKLRPAIQLRFRDADQLERIKVRAALSSTSVNEYILCAIEFAEAQAAKRSSNVVVEEK
jgi:hypothetical protein